MNGAPPENREPRIVIDCNRVHVGVAPPDLAVDPLAGAEQQARALTPRLRLVRVGAQDDDLAAIARAEVQLPVESHAVRRLTCAEALQHHGRRDVGALAQRALRDARGHAKLHVHVGHANDIPWHRQQNRDDRARATFETQPVRSAHRPGLIVRGDDVVPRRSLRTVDQVEGEQQGLPRACRLGRGCDQLEVRDRAAVHQAKDVQPR